MLLREGYNFGFLWLLQYVLKYSMFLIIGILFEGMYGIDGFSIEEYGEEQVLFFMVSLYLSDFIWIMMEFGDGVIFQILCCIFYDCLDFVYGMMLFSIFVIFFNFKSFILMQIGLVVLIQI